MSWKRLKNRLFRYLKKPHISIWYHPDYRLPVPSLSNQSHIELRRADFVVWELASLGYLTKLDLKTPLKIPYKYVAAVHTQEMLESLADPAILARAFSVNEWEIPVDEVLRTVRLACCGTLKAARNAITFNGPSMNLLGGFHHAHLGKPSGLCLVNDIAIAVKALREDGFDRQINIIDLDAHPPDGTADCLFEDPKVWIGSLSGSDWGELPGVDETLLPKGCSDGDYMENLTHLLERSPEASLTFVIAGGDVLDGDRFGLLGLSLEGARERDLLIAGFLRGKPSVWLPGGGYHEDSWRLLAGSVLAVFFGSRSPISSSYRPLKHHYLQIFHSINENQLKGHNDELLTDDDISEIFGPTPVKPIKFLEFYTAEGVELALFKYGILANLRRMGFEKFKIELRKTETGDLMRLKAKSGRLTCTLFEMILRKKKTSMGQMLYIDWFTLRNPKTDFKPEKPRLPGQEVPGLGMSKEAIEILFIMARRLNLDGVQFKPSWYHIAYAMRHYFQFNKIERQAKFLALIRDTKEHPLLHVTIALSKDLVLMNDEPYQWEADKMLSRADQTQLHDPQELEKLSEDYRFSLKESPPLDQTVSSMIKC